MNLIDNCMRDLDAATVRRLLSYNKGTGVFRWRVANSGRVRVGDVAGSVNSSGYVQIRIFGTKYKAHRLAWLHTYGEWPMMVIDHINRCRSDNRIANLRDVTVGENRRNAPPFSEWVRGAEKPQRHPQVARGSIRQRTQRFEVRCAGKHIGVYDTYELASSVLQKHLAERKA